MKLKNLFGNDRAVSPVIGVILMVAITVILAAVIGSFVLGIGSNVSQSAQAGVTFDKVGGTDKVEVTVNSMPNADKVSVTADVDNNTPYNRSSVGATATVENITTDDRIVVIGYLDGEGSVVAEYTE